MAQGKQGELELATVSDQARSLSRLGASRGGQARAASLSPETRRAIARQAAEARWGKSVLPATHTGELQIGGLRIACAVLEGGARLVSQQTLLTALGRSHKAKGGAEGTQLFAANLQPFIKSDLAEAIANPIQYTTYTGRQFKSNGYPAELLPEVCEVYLDARAEGVLLRSQLKAAAAAEVLIRGLARVGIIALVDEATGYQDVRARAELERILNAYVQAELRPWVKTFPDEFFKQIFRMYGWDYQPGNARRPQLVGKLINRYVYEQLPPGVHDELRRLNPRSPAGRRSHMHHQFLTADTGNVHLDRQIATVTTLMRIAHNKAEFDDLFDRAFPPAQERLPLVIDVDPTEGGPT